MGLINCPDCGKAVSDSASNCPHCGCNIRDYMSKLYHENKVNEIIRIMKTMADSKSVVIRVPILPYTSISKPHLCIKTKGFLGNKWMGMKERTEQVYRDEYRIISYELDHPAEVMFAVEDGSTVRSAVFNAEPCHGYFLWPKEFNYSSTAVERDIRLI